MRRRVHGFQGKVSRALISVTDKTGVVEFARALKEEFGVEIISTGGTAKALVDGGVPVTPIEEYTGVPRDDGRPRQDAAPQGPRRPAGPSRF